MTTPNLLHVQFKNPEYLTYLSSTSHPQLCALNLLEYFSTSPFYDRRSNNEQIRMQNIATNTLLSPRELEEELRRFVGLEYVIAHESGDVFVVHKRYRRSKDDADVLAAYYVVQESIYMAPDLEAVLKSRLHSTVHALKTSLAAQRNARPAFNPRRGHHGRFIVPDPEPQKKARTA